MTNSEQVKEIFYNLINKVMVAEEILDDVNEDRGGGSSPQLKADFQKLERKIANDEPLDGKDYAKLRIPFVAFAIPKMEEEIDKQRLILGVYRTIDRELQEGVSNPLPFAATIDAILKEISIENVDKS